MRRRLPPMKALPAFEIAAQQLSFSAAANELHLTHGAISRQVRTLEKHLGVELFRRLNRQIELTDAGIAFLPAVRTALDVLEASAAQISASPRQGPVVVSCLPTLMMRWLIPRLYDFNARHPDIEIRLAASYAPVNLERDGVDVAIRFVNSTPSDDVESVPFLDEEIGPVCSPTLLRRQPLQEPPDLRHHNILHTESRPDAWVQWLERYGATGVKISKGARFDHFYFMLEAAASGLGVGVAPRPLVAQDLASDRLVAPFGFVKSGRAYHLMYSRKARSNAKIMAFRNWLVQGMRSGRLNVPNIEARSVSGPE